MDGVRTGQRERCYQDAEPNRGERPPQCSPHGSLRDGEVALRGRVQRPGAVMLSCNGRPGTRQGGRTPHRGGAVLPVDAYSLAIACGSRGVSLDIWPASLFGTRRIVRCPSSRTRQGSLLVPHDTSRHDLVPATPVFPAGAGSLPRLGGPPGRRGTPSSARYRECGVRCLAMRRRPSTAAALQRGTRAALFAAFTRRALRPGHVACGDRCVRGTIPPHHHAGIKDLLSTTLAATGRKADFGPRHYRTPHRATGRGRRLRPLPGAGTVVTGLARRAAPKHSPTQQRVAHRTGRGLRRDRADRKGGIASAQAAGG